MGRSFGKVRPRAVPAPAARVADSFANFEARVGLTQQNLSGGSGYTLDYRSRNRTMLEASYKSSWICGMAIDAVAEDMTRAGIEVHSSIPPDQVEKLNAGLESMQIWDQLCDTVKWSRLYGGAIAVLLIDGQKPETPLNLNSVGRDQFKGLLVLDRWQVQPSLQDLVTDYGPALGKPKFYTVVADAQAFVNMRIHYSRVIRVEGVELPYWQRIAENLWGQSILERLWDRLIAFDSTTQGAAQLVYKAHLRTYKVKDMRNIIAGGGPAMEALVKQIEMIRRFQSNEGLTLMDAGDEFEAHQYAFAGLDNVLLQFGQQISGALQIPLVRLFGQSPAGLNATGDSDIRNYYDKVAQSQDRKLRPGLTTLLNVLHRSVLGTPPAAGFKFEFRPLWQMSETEKADVAQKVTGAVVQAYDSGIVGRKTALSELRHNSDASGTWSKITDEEIESADEDPPPPSESTIPEPSEAGNAGAAANARQEAAA